MKFRKRIFFVRIKYKMPKGRKKGAGGKKHKNADNHQKVSDEEYDTPDNASVTSSTSDAFSFAGEAVGNDEVDENSAQENFEDKLKESIDGLTQKSAQGRKDCMKVLISAMSKKYIYDFLIDRKLTVTDAIERCLKKGKGEEQAYAATVGMLLCLQLGLDGEEIFCSLKPILLTIMADTSASCNARAKCAKALGVCSFISAGDIEQITDILKPLENVFKSSYSKGDGSTPSHSPDVAAMHTSAISAWSLLLTIAPARVANELIDSHLTKFSELLESGDVELRISAGEAIALMYELARETDEDFEGDDIDVLIETLKQLATDSNKYRAKKDRRQQRSSFRDILRAVEEDAVPLTRIRLGITEYFDIDSWARKRQYDAMCQILGPGMNVHLMENELVREVFGLGPPRPIGIAKTSKASKFERTMNNAAAFKARTKARQKVRDKRAVAMNMDS